MIDSVAIGKTCTIIRSPELLAMRLKRLVGRKGVVVQIPDHRNGAFVEFTDTFLGEKEWYIPKESIQYC